ncbi:uncharacterized protein AMSG_05568 [Thecamonas trahens ATCC 50062]|uniref:Uncharacterized protein n=1 Tax=Thecamonas trahens ATCC 50062 TaxID=461836 RepID=A0A0L0DB12_THETB|nr:hypothetical protein AMSG_05568 [Thecamonas trahens ATCC 50062]KNC49539.1 hypothetical protein AMSG_05568 [Thecamonas trahens ATCC 50062]|eukprot:XP_013757651.1 hypothetical protein AMSG_05568 [Thecamonas trahens ATCC 50062]
MATPARLAAAAEDGARANRNARIARRTNELSTDVAEAYTAVRVHGEDIAQAQARMDEQVAELRKAGAVAVVDGAGRTASQLLAVAERAGDGARRRMEGEGGTIARKVREAHAVSDADRALKQAGLERALDEERRARSSSAAESAARLDTALRRMEGKIADVRRERIAGHDRVAGHIRRKIGKVETELNAYVDDRARAAELFMAKVAEVQRSLRG